VNVFGIDVGGSGIKGAPVNTQTGTLVAERVRIKTPKPATPEAIVETAVEVVRRSEWEGPVSLRRRPSRPLSIPARAGRGMYDLSGERFLGY
jgi:predicted NBD/HSP70 family sugar kinase